MTPILSYSAINDYHICPRRFYHKWVARDLPREEKSQAQIDGTAAHEDLRKRLERSEPLADWANASLSEMCKFLEDRPGTLKCEYKLGMKLDGTPCDFFADGVELRGVLDFVIMHKDASLILDWKTGKVREDPMELRIQALLLRANHPELASISAHYFWLKEGKLGVVHEVDDTASTLRMMLQYHKHIGQRVEDKDWPPDQNPLCGWCPVTKELCEFKK